MLAIFTVSTEAQQDIIIIPNRLEAEHQSKSAVLRRMEGGPDNRRLKKIQLYDLPTEEEAELNRRSKNLSALVSGYKCV